MDGRTYLVRITTDTCHTRNSEIERLNSKTSFLQERHDEAAKATVHVKTNLVLQRKFAEGDDVILISVREVYGRANNLKTSWFSIGKPR